MGYQEKMPRWGEKFSSIKRVTGVQPEVERKIKSDLAERFLNQDFLYFDMGIKEREKTRGQIEAIEYTGELSAGVSKKYGGEGRKIPERNVHILNEKVYERIAHGGEVYYNSYFQAVLLKGDFPLLNFPLELILRTLQADLRFLSYQTVKYVEDKSILRHLKDRSRFDVSQSGMHIAGETPKGEYFRNLNNAVIEKLVKDVFKEEIFNQEILKAKNSKLFELVKGEIEEAENMRQVAQGPDEVVFAKKQFVRRPNGKEELRVVYRTFSYLKEREALDGLIDKLYFKNKDKFKNKEEGRKKIFGLFARSVFTGDLEEWKSWLNESFGEGTYEELAEADRNVDKLSKFVKSLKV